MISIPFDLTITDLASRSKSQDLLHAFLVGIDECENMIIGAFQHALQDGQVRHHTARVEVLEAIEDQLISFRSDLQIAVARVDGATDELCEP